MVLLLYGGLNLRKMMRKSKGKWMIVGFSTATMTLSLQTINAEELVSAQEISTQPVSDTFS